MSAEDLVALAVSQGGLGNDALLAAVLPLFHETAAVLHNLIPARSSLLVKPEYSKEIPVLCPRCVDTPPFRLADARLVLSLIGYY